jgi:NAD+ synthetase
MPLNVSIAQLNPTIGDLDGNLALMLKAAEAAGPDCDLIVFPELSLTGYHPADMLLDERFLAKVRASVDRLVELTKGFPRLHWAVGAPRGRDDGRPGKALWNAVLILHDGAILAEFAKQLLPTYDVFDERRYFEPGPDRANLLRIGDTNVGFLVCEDGWNTSGQAYEVDPWHRLVVLNHADLVVSVNASPSNLGKRELREGVFADRVRRHRTPVLYVNQVGGHDQLVYDGSSFAMSPGEGGEPVTLSLEAFEPDQMAFVFADGRLTSTEASWAHPPALAPMDLYLRQIVLGLRDYARRCGFKTVVVGCSGGIDSALTLALAVDALGADNVTAITMPSSFSSEGSVTDSQRLCANLGIRLHTHPIREQVAGLAGCFDLHFGARLAGVALENVQARIRGVILMEYSNTYGALLLTTGNKSETSVGYCTLYGDTNGGLGLIGDLYKTEVFELARHYNRVHGQELIPLAIIDKAPSAELAPDQKDSDSLPPYPVLDNLLKFLVEGDRLGAEEAQAARTEAERNPPLLAKVEGMVRRNEYKRRQAPPILRLRPRAFGDGWKFPIAAKW